MPLPADHEVRHVAKQGEGLRTSLFKVCVLTPFTRWAPT